jgi:1L-myo-inositol 1-phosphate cytidylyltransferase / CDP-L-myo-inositol myo-inositolphosphotransferase
MEPAPAVGTAGTASTTGLSQRCGSRSARHPVAADWPPRTAVILAAGHGSRMSGGRRPTPKPLLKVAGLRLLERSLLTLKAAGIERFRVVLGADGPRIASEMRRLGSLAQLAIEFVDCPDFEAGNGASLATGASGLDDSFLVAMADHVMDTSFVGDFLSRAAARPDSPQVAADAVESVYDLDDATKLRTIDGRIQAIGKDLTSYSSVDAGLFFFPAGSGARIGQMVAAGARSVSDIVTRMAAERPFFATRVLAGMWQDVDTPAMAREAERRLLRSLAKSTDGFVARHLNRPISIFTSRFLARWGVRPNVITTFVTLISLVGAGLASTADPALLALGGILFQLASILDGCDGEVARLKLQGSRFGAWYDTLSDNVRYMVFYAALGVAGYRLSGSDIYLWALLPFLALSTFFVATMGRYVWRTQAHLTNLAVTNKVLSAKRTHWWEKLVLPLSGLIKQDVQAFAAMLFCLAALPGPYFWVTVLGSVLMTVSVVRGLGSEGKSDARAQIFLAYSAGLLLLAWLVSRMPVGAIGEAFDQAGSGIIFAFAAAPLWYAANAIGLGLLLDGRVRFRHLFYIQVVGEAMNTIVPLAGLGGDVFRARYLSDRVGTAVATRAVVEDRLVNILSGPLFSGAAIALTIWLIPLDPALVAGLGVVAALLLAAGLAMLGFVLSPYPSRWSNALLRRLTGDSSTVTVQALSRARLAGVLAAKMAGRFLSLIEISIILSLLGLESSPGLIIAIAGLLATSAVLFFFVPQGLGVNEAGIAGAFTMVGLAAPYGLAFGLIRRARVVTWAAIGVALHLSLLGIKRLRAARREDVTAAMAAEGS